MSFDKKYSEEDDCVARLSPKYGNKKKKKTKKKKRHHEKKEKGTMSVNSCSLGSDNSFSSDNDEMYRGSIEAVKRAHGFGNRLETHEDDYDRSADKVIAVDDGTLLDGIQLGNQQNTLEKEVRCAMCIDVLYKPVSLSCGHSLCRLCLLFALQNMCLEYFNRFQCPICRKTACVKCSKRFQVNTTLWNIICKLFPKQVAARNETQEKIEFDNAWRKFSGLSSLGLGDFGASLASRSDYGEEGISDPMLIRSDSFTLFSKCKFNRAVVKNSSDLVMNTALAFQRYPDPIPLFVRRGVHPSSFQTNSSDTSCSWKINVVLLELEEDEDLEAGGFPALLHDSRSETNQVLIKRSYLGSLELNVFADIGDGQLSHVFKTTSDFSDGLAKFEIDVSKLPNSFSWIKVNIQSMQSIGLNCHFDLLTSPRVKISDYLRNAFHPPLSNQDKSDESVSGGVVDLGDSEGESEPENYDEFEEDGFIVMDGENGDESDDSKSINSEDSEELVTEPMNTKTRGRKLRKINHTNKYRKDESDNESSISDENGDRVDESSCSETSIRETRQISAKEKKRGCINHSKNSMKNKKQNVKLNYCPDERSEDEDSEEDPNDLVLSESFSAKKKAPKKHSKPRKRKRSRTTVVVVDSDKE